MFSIHINQRMWRMKLHYFLYMGSIASIVGFSPTIAKQLGYSPMLVGSFFTYLSILAFLIKPISGMIVDKFPVKRIMFLTFIFICGLSAFALNFVQKLPTETAVNLNCDTTTTLNVCSNSDSQMSPCDDSQFKHLNDKTDPVTCQLLCQQSTTFWDEVCKTWNITDFCQTTNNTFQKNDNDIFNITFFLNITNRVEKNHFFQVKSIQVKDTQIVLPVCRSPVSTRCEINCSDDVIMGMATVSKFNGSIYGSHQFWEYFIVMTLFWISQAIIWSLHDPICFDLLGDKPEDFGKQRCWGSISWGIFMILGGVIVDYFSDSDFHKNYVPIFYFCLAIIICDFVVAYKIEITETTGSKNAFSDIFRFLANLSTIVYFLWIIVMGICTSMIWNYLFWYMEDITLQYQNDKQPWIKTLQGLAMGIQCIGGEMPFLFFSGWIIKRLGHRHCMSLGLFVFAVRFYLYSIIKNPVWILPIEFTNGITFGLFHAVLMGYARTIAPPSAVTTVIGFAGALFEGVGISFGGILGGFLYDRYGGAHTFQLFSHGSLLMCILLVIFTKFNK